MDYVGIVGSSHVEFEKTPSPEKEEEASRVELYSPDLEPEHKYNNVLDLSDLDESLGGYVAPIAEREPRAGDKAVEDLPELVVAKDGKVMELIDQVYIRGLLKSPPRTYPLPSASIKVIRRETGITDERVLGIVSHGAWCAQKVRDVCNDIIQQYLDKGYAYVKVPEDSERYPTNPQYLPPLP